MAGEPRATAALAPLLEGRLLLVTGKGGTGKSTVASALAVLAATRGRRVLLAELDMSRPSLDALFGIRVSAVPTAVHDRLDVVNVLYGPALEHFIGTVVPVRAVVRKVLDNPAIQRFLDFTPGAREMVTLSRVLSYAQDYDLVVVDLPASGHAFSLLDVTRSALGLFRSGPMRERAERMRSVLQQDSTRVALVALPEEMVVNETLETAERFASNGLFSRAPVVLLNRATQPTLTEPERTLLTRLEQADLSPHGAELVAAGRWEAQLEAETAVALERLQGVGEPVWIPPATEGGQPWEVLGSVAVHLGRYLGVSRRKLPDLRLPEETTPATAPQGEQADLDAWLAGRRLVVTVGSGGVGKTTSAAAIGLYAARHGRRAMVLTIDPARRLANSLGLDAFGNTETRIQLEGIEGELYAMMLDSRSTMDALIARVAEPEVAERIFGNHVYRHMADTFAGSQDYMATEKLYDLISSDRYDLVVLDTPPVKNALDFLESPGRLLNFLDEKVLTWFLAEPDKGWGTWMFSTSAVVHRLLRHVFGSDFLDDLTVFFRDFQGLYDGFRDRHAAVVAQLRSENTSFLTICAPTRSSLDVAAYFLDELPKRELPSAGVLVNQVHRCAFEDHDASGLQGSAAALAADLPPVTVPSLLARLGTAHRRLHSVVVAETQMIDALRWNSDPDGFFREVPRFAGQVHDLGALDRVGTAFFRG